MLIPKQAFACLMLISSLSGIAPALAATTTGTGSADTKLGAIETKIFSHTYSREATTDRVSRLEKFVFSGTKNEGSLDERIAGLASAVNVRNVGDAPYLPKRRPFTDWTPAIPGSSAAANNAANDVRGTRTFNSTSLSNYPRVTELEQRVFGQTYSGEPVAQRLNRLETKAFGRPSNGTDLAVRVDSLVAHVVPAQSLSPIRLASYHAGFQSNYRPATYSTSDDSARDSASNYHSNFFGLNRTADLASGVRGTQSYTVVDQIEYLENATFGKTRPNKSLQKRVGALEEKFYGLQKVEAEGDISSRVAHLWSKANATSHTANQTSSLISRGA